MRYFSHSTNTRQSQNQNLWEKKATQGGLNCKEAILSKALLLTTCNKQTFFRAVNKHTFKIMSERNKSLRSFCFEAFEHLVYPNAVTNKTRSGFSDECKSVKSRNFFRLIIMFLNRTTFPCRTINNLHVSLQVYE